MMKPHEALSNLESSLATAAVEAGVEEDDGEGVVGVRVLDSEVNGFSDGRSPRPGFACSSSVALVLQGVPVAAV